MISMHNPLSLLCSFSSAVGSRFSAFLIILHLFTSSWTAQDSFLSLLGLWHRTLILKYVFRALFCLFTVIFTQFPPKLLKFYHKSSHLQRIIKLIYFCVQSSRIKYKNYDIFAENHKNIKFKPVPEDIMTFIPKKLLLASLITLILCHQVIKYS